MRDYARVSPQFWTGKTGRALRRIPDAQRLALYLLTCPGANMIGVFYVASPTICHEVGIDADILAALWIVLEDLDFAYYDQDTEMVWVPNMAREQLDDALKAGDRRISGVVRQVDSIRRHRFARAFWDRYADAFSLASHGEAQGLVELFAKPNGVSQTASRTPSEASQTDARTASKPNTPSSEDQDQEQAQDQEQDQDLAAPISKPPDRGPARNEGRAESLTTEPGIWTSSGWLRKFKSAWETRPGRAGRETAFYGDTGDTKASVTLDDELRRLPRDVRINAQARAPAMFAEFLSRDDPGTVRRGHPFVFFVQEFGSLRIAESDRQPPPKHPPSRPIEAL